MATHKPMLDALREFIPFLSAYPTWVRVIVAAWIVLTAVLLIAFLFFRTPPTPKAEPVTANQSQQQPTSTPAAAPRSGIVGPFQTDAREYFRTLRELSDRFHHREKFTEEANGTLVQWQGFVRNVFRNTNVISVSVYVEQEGGESFFADLPTAMEADAFALHKGDLIQVLGNLDTGLGGAAPTTVKVEKSRLLKPAR